MRVLAGLLALAIASIAQAAPLSSAFTYQGELFDAGAPMNGQVDLRFTPFADAANPTLLGPPIVVEDVLVSAGVFTARVDFGPGFFVGDAVFLEIAVRPAAIADPDAFEALSPRQEVTAAPYTLKPAPGSVTSRASRRFRPCPVRRCGSRSTPWSHGLCWVGRWASRVKPEQRGRRRAKMSWKL